MQILIALEFWIIQRFISNKLEVITFWIFYDKGILFILDSLLF